MYELIYTVLEPIGISIWITIGLLGLFIFFIIFVYYKSELLIKNFNQNKEVEELMTTEIKIAERTEYPYKLDEFIGQSKARTIIDIMINAAKQEERPLEHLVFYGNAGLGKTTLANLIAVEMGKNFYSVVSSSMNNRDTIQNIALRIQEGDILFIDEIHSLRNKIAEIFYGIMQDFKIEILDEKNTFSYTYDIPKFTLIGATTSLGNLLKPMRDRFIHQIYLENYNTDELIEIINHLGEIDEESARELALRSQGVVRISKKYFKSCKNFALTENQNSVNMHHVLSIMKLMGISKTGLIPEQRKILQLLSENPKAQGIKNIVSSLGVDSKDYEEMYEPFLLQQGLINRTSRGRIITDKGSMELNKFNNEFQETNLFEVKKT